MCPYIWPKTHECGPKLGPECAYRPTGRRDEPKNYKNGSNSIFIVVIMIITMIIINDNNNTNSNKDKNVI